MRIYKSDGTFVEKPNDTEFGWYIGDVIAEDSATANVYKEENITEDTAKNDDRFLESVDIIEPQPKPLVIKKIDPKVRIESFVSVFDCKMEIEGPPVNTSEPKLIKELKNINCSVPSKEKLADLVTPYSTETKALLSVIYFAKYKSQMKDETLKELLKSINFKTTDSKHLINDIENSVREEVYQKIKNSHSTKEDNLLSLMMELILTQINTRLEDIVDVNQVTDGSSISNSAFESSDLGNSMQSSYSDEGEECNKCRYPEISNRSNILNIFGLSGADKIIQSLSEETMEMHLQLADIKENFHEVKDKTDELIKMAISLQKDLKETVYLDDVLHLLNGDIEKVKSKKLPFRAFHRGQEGGELNLII